MEKSGLKRRLHMIIHTGEDGDHGPGTGGMGAFSMAPGEQLPFLTGDDYQEAIAFQKTFTRSL